ncbi:MAG: transketolase [Pseudomonadota bacterium]
MRHTEMANAIRALTLDAVDAAQSGHPGAPLGLADVATVLWADVMRHDPNHSDWPNRDRFILSNGHASMLLYSLLHLSGYPLSLDELKNFRQLGSKTPGHPEWHETPGVETTTGPLGQGFANAVGMAIAERTLAAQFNKPDHSIIDHYTYVILGDGCMMEGISHETASLAGCLGLSKLIALYDDNGISIDGPVDGWFRDDTPARFRAYGWHVIEAIDGHNPQAVHQALIEAKQQTAKPTLICCKTTIGFGSHLHGGKESSHGAPFGAKETTATKQVLSWVHPDFFIPESVISEWRKVAMQGAEHTAAWNKQFEAYQQAFPAEAAELQRRFTKQLPSAWQTLAADVIQQMTNHEKPMATRKSSQLCLEILAPQLPEMLGGSADLTHSNNTNWKTSKGIHIDAAGSYVYYGVREFGMTAIMNGISLYGGFRPFGGTFLVFMEYARNAVRMAALMHQPIILVYTHDSIGLGEDGPTHQPIEQLASLRATPGLETWRPADAVETAISWKAALERLDGPSSLILSRQNLMPLKQTPEQITDIERGAYVVCGSSEDIQVILIATGSEVELARTAFNALQQQGIHAQLVSMPCVERFRKQPKSYRDRVLPPQIKARVAIEAGCSQPWWEWVGLDGAVIGLDRFGVSAPGPQAYAHLGFTTEQVVGTVQRVINTQH